MAVVERCELRLAETLARRDHRGVEESEPEVGVLALERRSTLHFALVSAAEPVTAVRDLMDEQLPLCTARWVRSQKSIATNAGAGTTSPPSNSLMRSTHW